MKLNDFVEENMSCGYTHNLHCPDCGFISNARCLDENDNLTDEVQCSQCGEVFNLYKV